MNQEEYDFLKGRYSSLAKELGYDGAFMWQSVGSTNDEARKAFSLNDTEFGRACDSHASAVFWALEQTAGRGRLGRTWDSEEGSGIYMSFVVRALEHVGALTIAAGASVCRSLREMGYDAMLKWPNDVLIDGKKVCGILSELIINENGMNYVVVGAGLNLTRSFAGDLSRTAISLKDVSSKDVSFAFGHSPKDDLERGMRLMMESVGSTVRHYFSRDKSIFIDLAKMYSATINSEVEVHNVHDRDGYLAIARDIDTDGALIVELSTGEYKKVFAGEVTLRRKRATNI
ncbi:MAG: biotin--[acetyl-CoA-carboxylase] ligase [Bacillota bacterium]|nr:biotin--[acetyl-CoA-carboxylase] ligase [Bacillota bacterium]